MDDAFLSISKEIVTRLKVNPEHYGTDGGGGNSNGQVRIKETDKNKQKSDSSCC